MRNLKRALSLLLSSTMVLGMLVMGSSAASYKDVTSEYNKEAIDVMEAVSVMVGDENGNFNPDQNVTRAQMAVIMANLLDLKVDDFKNAVIPFTDVPEWARPYVAACYADGITAGTSATTYGSNDTVTAAQAGLMMLKALGYFQNPGDFGNDWQLAAIKQASKIDLYDGINAGATTALTRNEVAQLGLNTLEATMVEPDGTSGSIDLGDIVIDLGGTKYAEVVSSSSYAKAFADQIEYDKDGDAENKQTVQLGEKLYDGDLKKGDSAPDAFGRPSNQWKYKTSEVGTYAKEADATYTAEIKSEDLYKDLGLDEKVTATVYTDGTGKAQTGSFDIEKNSDAPLGGNGVLIEAYKSVKNGKDAVTLTVINTYLAQVDGDYDKDDEELDLASVDGVKFYSGTLSSDNFSGLNAFEDEDYVLLTIANDEVKSIEKAEVLNATVTSYTKGKSVTADGTKYEYSASAESAQTEKVYTLKDEYTLVLDKSGYVLYTDGVEASGNYVYVTEFGYEGAVNQTWVANAYFANGTSEVIKVHSNSKMNDQNASEDVEKNAGWYTYTTKSDKYVLTPAGDGDEKIVVKSNYTITSTEKFITENGKVSINNIDGTLKANSKTVFLIDDGDKVTLYTGIKNVPDIKVKDGKKAAASAVVENGYVTYLYVDAENCSIKGASSSSSDRVYILDKTPEESVNENDDTYYTYDAIVNGKETTINTTDNSYVAGLYTNVSYDANDYVDSMDIVASNDNDDYNMYNSFGAGVKILYQDGVLTFGGESAKNPVNLVLADSYKIFVVDTDGDVTTVTASKLAKDYAAAQSFKGTVYTTLDEDGYVAEVYCQLAQ